MRARTLLPLLALCLLAMGMGSFGGDKIITSIPRPDRDFRVEVTDGSGVAYVVDSFSIDGLTTMPAKMGLADMGIDFAKIEAVRFLDQGDGTMVARVEYRDGTVKNLEIKKSVTFLGQTEWGKVRITAGDIRTIEFLGTVREQAASQ